jgi:phosphoribosyl-AMP cyclohydrolase
VAFEGLKYNADGLIPAIVQDDANGEVLMMAWMNAEALRLTLETRRVTYWSRSRQAFWIKGETSGHIQNLKSVSVDCDLDTLLVRVEQVGAACHEGYRSCFFRDIGVDGELEGRGNRAEGEADTSG